MTRDEIISMALEAGFPLRVLCPSGPSADMGEPLMAVVTRFAALVEAREREECAKVCDDIRAHRPTTGAGGLIAEECATAIRARAGKETSND